jgi:hypothetical protein
MMSDPAADALAPSSSSTSSSSSDDSWESVLGGHVRISYLKYVSDVRARDVLKKKFKSFKEFADNRKEIHRITMNSLAPLILGNKSSYTAQMVEQSMSLLVETPRIERVSLVTYRFRKERSENHVDPEVRSQHKEWVDKQDAFDKIHDLCRKQTERALRNLAALLFPEETATKKRQRASKRKLDTDEVRSILLMTINW